MGIVVVFDGTLGFVNSIMISSMGCVLCSTVCVQQCREFLNISADIKRLGLFRVRVLGVGYF